MIHKSCSIQEVIGRVIRNTRIQDSSYITDMYEWIPEAMEFMRTKMELSYTFKDVEINFHKGKMPCGLIHIMAIEYNGCRLEYKTGSNNSYRRANTSTTGLDLFVSTIKTQDVPDGNYIWKSDIRSVGSLPVGSGSYSIEMDYINTSICDGMVRVHYMSQPLDCDGLPLIPDNANYKEAIYYYVRAKMIGCGYKDNAFSEQELMQRFEIYASRAMGQIRYPSMDLIQKRMDTLMRFIPPEDYWNNFFEGSNGTVNLSAFNGNGQTI